MAKKPQKRVTKSKAKVGSKTTRQSGEPPARGAFGLMGRGGKWLVVTAAIAAVTSATTLAVTKTGEKITAPDAPSGPPVSVASVSVVDPDDGDSFAFAQPVDLSRSELDAIRDHDRYRQWIVDHGGVIANDEGKAMIQLTLRGNRDYQVRILDMQAIERCGAPLTGTLFYSPSAGEGQSAALGFDLDKPYSSAKQYSFETGFGENYFPAKTISLNYKEQQVLSVFSKTKQYCEFRIRLKVLDGDKTVYETIGNGQVTGEKALPFRITRMVERSDSPQGLLTDYRRVYAGGVSTAVCAIRGRWVDISSTGSLPEGDC